jgi:hypothetical protein
VTPVVPDLRDEEDPSDIRAVTEHSLATTEVPERRENLVDAFCAV